MDSRSHVAFAAKLLPSESRAATPASLFPQIDRQPAPLHRNYAHYLQKATALTSLGLQTLYGSSEGDTYASRRFREERTRILSYFPEVDSAKVQLTPELERAAQVAFVSHLYLDTFNQPVQAFVPFKSNVSGQFEMWDRIGDFRYRLYIEGTVEELRAEWIKSKIWSDRFELPESLEAMVLRLAEMAGLEKHSTPVQSAFKSLGIGRDASSARAHAWLLEMEDELVGLHKRYLG